MPTLIFLWAVSLISQLGRHFWPRFAYVGGLPIDYLSLVVYVSELATLVLSLSLLPKLVKLLKPKPALIFLILTAANILFAANHWLAAYTGGKILLFALIVLIIKSFDDKQIRTMLAGLKLALLICFGLALGQLVRQQSLGGVFYFLGERNFNLTTPVVAKFIFAGQTWLRPYASFSHPNSLAGFIVVSLIIFNFYQKNVSAGVWWKIFGLGLLLLTGSRIALAAAIVFLGLLLVKRQFMAHKISLCLLALAISSSVALTLIQPDIKMGETVFQRLTLAQTMAMTASRYPLTGVGMGNSIPVTFNTSIPYQFNLWYQPVHNVWLLLLTETGAIITAIVILCFWTLNQLLIQKKNFSLWAGWQAVLITSLFDHYWLTLPQNRMILAVLLGISLRSLTEKTSL